MHWRLLVAVADAGSISGAAECLGVTQSGASQALRSLEDGLGVRLLSREHRRTLPTRVGIQVIEQARVMLAALERIQAGADAARGLERASLRLASFPAVSATLLAPLLQRFRRAHPGIEVIVLEASDEEVEDLLATNAVDVGVLLNPPPERQATPLGRDAWVAVVAARHPWARRGLVEVALRELVDEPFVLATGGCKVNARSLAREAGLRLGQVRAEVRDWNSALALVRENLGVTLVPRMVLPDALPGLRVLALSTPLHREFALVAAPAAGTSAVVRALLDNLGASYGTQGDGSPAPATGQDACRITTHPTGTG
ncbi:LysR family transcriptional regulator [Pseudomonas sp. RIT-PI-AD]|uniref:LysR family transcriptional regulator n=1 Tax=Pseudomonas sp. RIT-PI-AD TaxID=3035294 RepID=UPI0021DA6D3A|nr:LysR family transcriptional regulator [Pseudomonas sp. RIT-PI-AD]